MLYATSLVAYYLYRRCVKRLLTRQAEGPAVGVVAFVAAWTPRRYQDPRAVAAEVRMAVWRPNGSGPAYLDQRFIIAARRSAWRADSARKTPYC